MLDVTFAQLSFVCIWGLKDWSQNFLKCHYQRSEQTANVNPQMKKYIKVQTDLKSVLFCIEYQSEADPDIVTLLTNVCFLNTRQSSLYAQDGLNFTLFMLQSELFYFVVKRLRKYIIAAFNKTFQY